MRVQVLGKQHLTTQAQQTLMHLVKAIQQLHMFTTQQKYPKIMKLAKIPVFVKYHLRAETSIIVQRAERDVSDNFSEKILVKNAVLAIKQRRGELIRREAREWASTV